MSTCETDLPAWVEAGGTLLALFLTGGLAWWETKARRLDERERNADALAAKVALITLTIDVIDAFIAAQASDERKTNTSASGHYLTLNYALDQAQHVTLADMPTPDAVKRLFGIEAGLRQFREAVHDLAPGWLTDAQMARVRLKQDAIHVLHRGLLADIDSIRRGH